MQANRDTSFHIKTSKSNNTAIKLTITGEVNDTFMIQHIKIPGGKINTSFNMDFYTSESELSYQHYKATSGKLLINYDIP